MISVTLRPGYRGVWLARARIFGKSFEAEGELCIQGLAKELVAAGIVDQPLQVHQRDVAGFAAIQSFRQLAEAAR